nr:zinc finger, CCHC-type [Tanacetum cinerariifolium]
MYRYMCSLEMTQSKLRRHFLCIGDDTIKATEAFSSVVMSAKFFGKVGQDGWCLSARDDAIKATEAFSSVVMSAKFFGKGCIIRCERPAVDLILDEEQQSLARWVITTKVLAFWFVGRKQQGFDRKGVLVKVYRQGCKASKLKDKEEEDTMVSAVVFIVTEDEEERRMTGDKFDIEKFDGTGDFGLRRVKMRTLLIQHGCEAALEVLPTDMEAQAKAEVNKKAHSVVILCLGNKVLREVIRKTTAAEHHTYEHFMDTLLYGRKALTLEDVMAILNSKEIKERSKINGDDGERLYVRGRTDRGDSRQSRNNRKKSTSYVNKDDQPSSSGSIYDGSEVMMVMGVEALLDWIMDSGDSYHMTPMIDLFFDYLECDGGSTVGYIPELKINLISLGNLEKEVYTVKLQSGKIKVINGTRVVFSGTQRDNCVYSVDGHAVTGELNASVDEKDSLAHVWHKRLGHISEAGLQVLEKQGLIGKKSLDKLDFYENYVLGKSHRVNFGGYGFIFSGSNTRHLKSSKSGRRHPSDYGMLRTFACVAYSHVKQGKLELRAVKCVHLGYPEGVKGYRLYMLNNGSPKIVTSRNVVFNESVMYKDTLKDSSACANKSVEELQLVRDREPRTRTKPLRFQDKSNMVAYASAAAKEEDTHEPLTYQEAVACDDSSKWKAAMEEEMDSLRKNKTWELVDHPAGKKLVSCKWLFKIKEEIKVRHTSIWVILALTACKDYELEQLDVKTTFLHENLKEIIYMRQPSGYEQDDMLIACESKAEIGSTETLLKREFDMKEIGEAKKILGMEIIRDRSRKILMVSQSGYVSKILNNFRIDNGKLVQMPLGGHFKLLLKDCPVRDCDVERISKVPYANAVGSLMYLMLCTRPDIAYAVRYLENVGLVYRTNRSNHVDVIGFVDSDYAKDQDKGRSGYTFLVQGCVVSWQATLQHVVALSTTEAEYMALIEAVKEGIWLRGLLEELCVELNKVTVNCDNQGAIYLSWNHVFHERTKHINVRYHFIREVLKAKTVEVLKVGTEYNDADALIKVVKENSKKDKIGSNFGAVAGEAN